MAILYQYTVYIVPIVVEVIVTLLVEVISVV